jgi:hypothetical protein
VSRRQRNPRNREARRLAPRKERRSFTLSPESVEYIDRVQQQQNQNASAVVDELIRKARVEEDRERERARLDAAFTAYYNSLTEEQQAEDREWGKFAEEQMTE